MTAGSNYLVFAIFCQGKSRFLLCYRAQKRLSFFVIVLYVIIPADRVFPFSRTKVSSIRMASSLSGVYLSFLEFPVNVLPSFVIPLYFIEFSVAVTSVFLGFSR